MSRLSAGSARWSQPVWISEDLSLSEQNPVLFLAPSGQIWLLYTAQETRGGTKEEWVAQVQAGKGTGDYGMQWTAIIRRRLSDDNGHTWGPVEDFITTPGAFCRQPLLIMSNGEWLLPMYYSLPGYRHSDDYTVMQISADQGQSWQECPVPHSRGRVQASVLELEPGRLVAFMRSRAADWIYVSHSLDFGRTWTAPEATPLPNNNSSMQAAKLTNGNLVMVFNNFRATYDSAAGYPDAVVWPQRRYPVTVALSEDQGRTWPYMRDVDASDGFSGAKNQHLNRRLGYPCILQTADGTIHVAYSYRGRQCIKYVRVTEDWIRHTRDYVYEG
jgi:predicted neuraminidase